VLAALTPLGLDLPTAVAVLRLMNNYMIGSALRETSESRDGGTGAADYRAAVASYVRQLAASGQYPPHQRPCRRHRARP
jgi:Tetracyclin repressor-like, C-terminal domain